MTDYMAEAHKHLQKAGEHPGYHKDDIAQHLEIAREYAKLAAIEKGLAPGSLDGDPEGNLR
jgi:hypothetical protein